MKTFPGAPAVRMEIERFMSIFTLAMGLSAHCADGNNRLLGCASPGITVPRAGDTHQIGQTIEVEHGEMAKLRSEVRDAVVALFDELREQA